MKQILLLGFLLSSFFGSAQLNMELLSEVEYPGNAGNDVWGYVAPDNSEYAIMGTFDGVSVVNITDPENPIEVDFIEQQGSTWRDIKTWGEYAYVTADEQGTTDGLLVIDMRNLPDSISYQNMNLQVPGEGIINTCHNLYIDEFGYAYLSGCGSLNAGGLLIWDVATTPGEPIFAGLGFREYSHDVYVRDNIAYSSEIAKTPQTTFSAYDVSDKSNVTLLGSQFTPGNATHNAWLSDDGKTIFTTDEVADAPIASYDVSDLSDIRLLDEYRPSATLNTGVVPHNVHVWDDWLIISYYTDGCIVVDAARPDNLIEVGNFDTFFGVGAGFNGAWGAYPFFPSGTVIVGEMGGEFMSGDSNGKLVVLRPTYVRASYLEGLITNSEDGLSINNAEVVIDGLNVQEFSKANGEYKTGTHENGTFTVTVSAFGFESVTRDVILENGQLTTENFELTPLPRIDIDLTIVDEMTNEGIENAKVLFTSGAQNFEYTTDENGNVLITDFVSTEYEIIAGAWGYQYNIAAQDFSQFASGNGYEIRLEEGYEDIFSLDLGWEKNFTGFQGAWERGIPIGQSQGGVFLAPGSDSDDLGNHCYVTGNSRNFSDGFMIGNAELLSPVFDVTDMMDPVIEYDTWFWVSTFNGQVDSEDYIIYIDNGIERVVIDSLDFDLAAIFAGEPNQWTPSRKIGLKDYISITDSMRLVAQISEEGFNSAVEGGFDNFRLYDSGLISTEEIIVDNSYNIYPNPSQEFFNLRINNPSNESINLSVYNLNGQIIESQTLRPYSKKIDFGYNLNAGSYFVKIVNAEGQAQFKKIIKL